MQMESAKEGNNIPIPENIVCVEIFLVTKKQRKQTWGTRILFEHD